MEEVKNLAKPEITLAGGFLSQYGGFTGYENHYYSTHPELWKKHVNIKVEKEELNTTEPAQQGSDPADKFKKPNYKNKSFDILKDIKFQDINTSPDGSLLSSDI